MSAFCHLQSRKLRIYLIIYESLEEKAPRARYCSFLTFDASVSRLSYKNSETKISRIEQFEGLMSELVHVHGGDPRDILTFC